MKIHYLLEDFVSEHAMRLMSVEEAVKTHRKERHLPASHYGKMVKEQYKKTSKKSKVH